MAKNSLKLDKNYYTVNQLVTKKMKKNASKIWSCQKNVVPLQSLSLQKTRLDFKIQGVEKQVIIERLTNQDVVQELGRYKLIVTKKFPLIKYTINLVVLSWNIIYFTTKSLILAQDER